MIPSNEQLFQSVFNYATMPMFVVNTDFIIIAHNKQHKIISNTLDQDIIGVNVGTAFESLTPAEALTLLMDNLMLSKNSKEVIQLPSFHFVSLAPVNDETENIWRIEIVPVLNDAQEVDYLLTIWHAAYLPLEILPAAQIKLNEELAATGEQIEAGTEQLENAVEELEAINDELTQTQEELNKLSQELEEKENLDADQHADKRQEVESQRDRLKRFLMQAPAGICVLDGPEFVFELVNPSFQELFPNRDLLGKTFVTALPEIKGQLMWEILQEVYATGEAFQGSEMLIPLANEETGNAEERYFNFIYQARFDSAGKIDGILLFVYEVTDMVLVRLEVEENEQRFRLLLNAIPQIAWTNTVEGEINFYNEQWYSYTGMDADENQRMALRQMMHPEDLKNHVEKFKAILASEDSGHYETRLKDEDGGYKWYLIRMQPIKDDEDIVLLWIGTATDINDLKILQQQKDDFISIASHELKTPVASLKASMQLLDRMKHNSSEKMQSLIGLAGKSVDKVSGLIDSLLDSNQLAEGGVPLHKTLFNLSELIDSCAEQVFRGDQSHLIITGEKDLRVNADQERIEQVIINMLTNAVKYAPGSKDIIINLEKISDTVKVSVIDKGPGIPAEKTPYLFDRYYRVEESRQPGLGLGLYICAEIIAKHEGKIGADSEVGVGSTFWFILPL
ncbi:PAS domain-containing sensor histidine kinase [Pedobacter cryoconitis]|uniref:histidine kinase n=1 Tax=Pedobacter cryoconitis TaxID=188932 RepID=A0A327SAD7_9SPHI|nr:PAS domain-containing sensor histidine kinase [Pedobacter cryoconitis]RAJ24904.1 PAS domain S-box-containing protein [Pedobacter cryoconitis]